MVLFQKLVSWLFNLRSQEEDTLYRTLDLEVVLNCLLSLVHQACESDNVIWIREDEFQTLHNLSRGIHGPEEDQALHRSVKFNAYTRATEQQVAPRLSLFEFQSQRQQAHMSGSKFDILQPCFDGEMRLLGYLFVSGVRRRHLNKTLRFLNRTVSNVSRHLGFAFEHWRVQSQNYCDDLTGLYNQKFLSQVIENEIGRSTRKSSSFCVLFMDIDRFKAINDMNGHWIGSKLLAEVGQILKSALRKNDYAFRYGGDEFVAVLPNTDARGGQIAAERIRQILSSTDFLIDGVHLKLTASIGLAAFPEHAKTYRDIVKMADAAMYCGKNASRNVVYVANS